MARLGSMKTSAHYETLLAPYYDDIYEWKNYKLETEKLLWLIQNVKQMQGRDLLDVACGTGGHLVYLKKHFQVTGVDASQAMLKKARAKCPKARLIQGDMRSFRLRKQFDVLTCLFSSIGHLPTETDLEKTIANFARHVKPNGLVIIEPFVDSKSYVPHKLHPPTVTHTKDLTVVRLSHSTRKAKHALIDFHILVHTEKGIEHFRDEVELSLFEKHRVLKLMQKHGFKSWYMSEGLMPDRGLYVGIKAK